MILEFRYIVIMETKQPRGQIKQFWLWMDFLFFSLNLIAFNTFKLSLIIFYEWTCSCFKPMALINHESHETAVDTRNPCISLISDFRASWTI